MWRIAICLVLPLIGCGARSGLAEPIGALDEDGSVSDGSLADTSELDSGGFIEPDALGSDTALPDSTLPELDAPPPSDGIVPPDVFADTVAPPDGPLPVGCPLVLPLAASACAEPASLECAYRGCNPLSADRARCVDGRWAVAAAACVSICPVGIQTSFAPCAIDDGYACLWDNGCPEGAVGFCRAGKWQVKSGGCPKETCPPGIVDGSACAPAGFQCLSPSKCGHTDYVICDGGRWFAPPTAACDAPAPCPTAPPKRGTACSGSLRCGYPNSCGSIDSYLCGGTWIEFPGRCAAKECPDVVPIDHHACSGSADCNYPIGGGCAVDCRCDGTHWICKQPPCESK